MSVMLRGPSTHYHVPDDGANNQANGWFDFVVPGDYVSGEAITFHFVMGVVAETVAPDSLFCFVNGGIMTMDGGVVGVGPYSGSGHSYAIGVTRILYPFNNGSGIFAVGLDNARSFTSNDIADTTATLVDGTAAGYPGEGMFSYAGGTILHGPVGWFPGLDATAGSPGGVSFSPGDTVSLFFNLWCESDDNAHPERYIYPVIQSITVTYGSHTIPIALTDVHSGFNTGGTGVTTTEGPQTYPAWHAIDSSVPVTSTYAFSPWLTTPLTPAQPYHISVGLIPGRVGTGGAGL